jgi:hypothetical protein
VISAIGPERNGDIAGEGSAHTCHRSTFSPLLMCASITVRRGVADPLRRGLSAYVSSEHAFRRL